MSIVGKALEQGEKMATSARRVVARLDGWANVMTGLGTSRDRRTAAAIYDIGALADTELKALFRSSDLARRMVSALPYHALRQGVHVANVADDPDANEVQQTAGAVSQELQRLRARERFLEASVWGRLYGGGAILLGVEGGGPPNTPLEDDRVTAVRFLSVLERKDLQPASYYVNPLAEKFGEVETWRLTVKATTAGAQSLQPLAEAIVHETRLIRFGGAMTTPEDRRANQGWDDSVLQSCVDVLRDADMNWGAVCHLMTDYATGVLKIKDFMGMLVGNEEAAIRARLEVMDLARSVVRSMVVDADGESYERVTTNMSGIPEVLQQTWMRLAAAADMPVTVLMGMSPAGLNATGESDIRNWYDRIKSFQCESLEPGFNRLVQMLARLKGASDAESYRVRFPSLWQMSPTEEATYRKLVADTDAVYIDKGVVLPEEITLSRWGKGEYSAETTVDLDVRRGVLDEELTHMEDDAANPPTPPPALPPPPTNGAPQLPPGDGVAQPDATTQAQQQADGR